MEPARKNIFFTGLNELRAIAALAVIFHHIELFKYRDHIGSLFNSKYSKYFIENLGENGVYLFFVLSGFLITYLLISEKEKNSTINLKKFYLRRILRIWPLYYLIILISFTLIPLFTQSFTIFSITSDWYDKIMDPSNYSLKTILLYILFLPNLASEIGKIVVGASQSWSVGVEEQFYILWPLLISFLRKNLLIWAFGLILFTFIIINVKFPQSLVGHITSIIPFEFMAIGGIGGYYYSKYPEIITKYTKNKFIYLTTALLIVFLISTPIFKHYMQSLISGFFFLLLILISINQSNRSIFTNRSFSFLGNISYGIYMYHPIVMFFIFPISYKLLHFCNNIYLFNIFIYLLIPSLTIFISYFSFEYIEKYFIKIKDTKFKTL